jgi:hypothetical protein
VGVILPVETAAIPARAAQYALAKWQSSPPTSLARFLFAASPALVYAHFATQPSDRLALHWLGTPSNAAFFHDRRNNPTPARYARRRGPLPFPRKFISVFVAASQRRMDPAGLGEISALGHGAEIFFANAVKLPVSLRVTRVVEPR